MKKYFSQAHAEFLMENVNRNIDLEGSDVTVNSITSDIGVTVTSGGALFVIKGQRLPPLTLPLLLLLLIS